MKNKYWEYKIVASGFLITDADLNKLGVDGWELVSATGQGNGIKMFFKRQLPEAIEVKDEDNIKLCKS